jgi:hypothetical protein
MMTDRIGFVQPGRKPDDGLNGKLERTALGAARHRFAPEFMNRLDKVVVFQSLRPTHLKQILEIELAREPRARPEGLVRLAEQARRRRPAQQAPAVPAAVATRITPRTSEIISSSTCTAARPTRTMSLAG